MAKITVIHKRNERHYPADRVVYVGRPSPLGNPFPMSNKADVHERARVIEQFHGWLKGQLEAQTPAVVAELQRIVQLAKTGPVYLMCWCAPEPCHAEIIAMYAALQLPHEPFTWPKED